MYIKELSKLSNFEERKAIIEKLDSWLTMRSRHFWKHLNPLQFAIDTGIDKDTAVSLFAESVRDHVGVMKGHFVLICPVCGQYHDVTGMGEQTFICPNKEVDNQLLLDESQYENIVVEFELLVEPRQPATQYDYMRAFMSANNMTL